MLLDEADSMTSAAQQAMRRTMELYSNTTRFALACNASEKIIEPIQSRCAVVRFSRLSDQEVLQRIMQVIEMESVPYVPDGVEAVVFTADGDMRQALNNLQATHSGFGFVNQENVFKVCDQPHPQIISDCVAHCLALNVDDAYDRIKFLYTAGFSAMDIIGTVYRVVKNYNSEAMPEFVKLEMIREVGFAHMRVGDGVNSLLQMAGLCAKLCKVAEGAKAGTMGR